MGNSPDNSREDSGFDLAEIKRELAESHIKEKADIQEFIENWEEDQRVLQRTDNFLKESYQRTSRILAHIDTLLQIQEQRIQARYRVLKIRAVVLIAIGLIAGLLFLVGATYVNKDGLASRVMDAFGTASLGAATVGVVAYFIARYWNAGETSNKIIFQILQQMNDRLIGISVRVNSDQEVLQRLNLFLGQEGFSPSPEETSDGAGLQS